MSLFITFQAHSLLDRDLPWCIPLFPTVHKGSRTNMLGHPAANCNPVPTHIYIYTLWWHFKKRAKGLAASNEVMFVPTPFCKWGAISWNLPNKSTQRGTGQWWVGWNYIAPIAERSRYIVKYHMFTDLHESISFCSKVGFLATSLSHH